MSDPKLPAAIRLATRASPLAMWQAEHVAALLRAAAPNTHVAFVHVTTTGDQERSLPLAGMGGVGVFTREVQRAVLEGRADAAVHSLKDLPTDMVRGLTLAGVPARGPRFDVLVLPGEVRAASLQSLRGGARVGTGSLRRQAQLLRARPDLVLANVRGNVETRLRKLDAGEFDALVLAEAGLHRLGLAPRISLVLEPPEMLPAVGQAAIGVECRAEDAALIHLLERISDPVTRAEVTVERACLEELRAGCHAPVGVYARMSEGTLLADGVVLSREGHERLFAAIRGRPSVPEDVGRRLAAELFRLGAARLIGGDPGAVTRG